MPALLVERRFPRYAIQIPLLHKAETFQTNPFGIAWTRNLSEGGACVEFAAPLQPDSSLDLRLQTDRGAIAAAANVVWVGDSDLTGNSVPHGLTFRLLSSDQRRALQEVVTWGKEQRRADIRLSFEVSVTCQQAGSVQGPPIEGLTGDFSRGGLLLLLPQVLASGTLLALTLQTVRGPLTARGKIVWVESPAGQLLAGYRELPSRPP